MPKKPSTSQAEHQSEFLLNAELLVDDDGGGDGRHQRLQPGDDARDRSRHALPDRPPDGAEIKPVQKHAGDDRMGRGRPRLRPFRPGHQAEADEQQDRQGVAQHQKRQRIGIDGRIFGDDPTGRPEQYEDGRSQAGECH
jgi:hypothetical protein